MKSISYKHKRSFLGDLAAAVKLTMEWRKAEKQRATGVKVEPVTCVPVVDFGRWSWTAEALLSYPQHPSGTREAVKAVFNSFDDGTQRKLTFGPGDHPGALVERAKFWQEALKPSLTKEQYSAAILTIIDWCIWCAKRSNKEEITA